MINIALLCMGRQPLFRPGGISHEIGKLPQQIIDRIPLVMYIPTPPPKEGRDSTGKELGHTYPPPPAEATTVAKEPTAVPASSVPEQKKRHRFFFFRRKNGKQPDLEAGDHSARGTEEAASKMKRKGTEDEWEANWERGDYPFVKLPDNRATCAICLLDFEEPPRRGANSRQGATTAGSIASTSSRNPGTGDGPAQADGGGSTSVPVEPLALQDAGEGATPLRLLACGHAFHQTCLDPWLKDVSGRCPVCQKKVDIEELERLSKKGRSTSWATHVVTPPTQPTQPGPEGHEPSGVSPSP